MCSWDVLFFKIVKCLRILVDIIGLSKCSWFDEVYKSDFIDVFLKFIVLKDFNVL